MKHKNTGKDGWCALKLDMSKAYDKVEWPFISAVMERMGFDKRWISLIMKCIQSVTYNVVTNGLIADTIHPERGLRQGDPLSPYLFLMCIEGLSTLLTKMQIEGLLKGVRASVQGPRIAHLFLVDDSLLFFKANQQKSKKSELNYWDEENLREHFDAETVMDILAILVSYSGLPDILVWHHTKTGQYSVRSACHLMGSLEGTRVETIGNNSTNWKRLWQLSLLRKRKIFAWRMENKALPAYERLERRRMNNLSYTKQKDCHSSKEIWIQAGYGTEWLESQ
ncbi:uncharacterized protein LOC111308099 [Durio zibethinus]|uniref:Uncharacterized protein LOC111308099 n=1 Tax=Durio zibethinus TaxID=66656 RepID=A0A6P6ABJ0_DURZI|nr:uncharacterized protein LOC111308099 [Durio zibethinus]